MSSVAIPAKVNDIIAFRDPFTEYRLDVTKKWIDIYIVRYDKMQIRYELDRESFLYINEGRAIRKFANIQSLLASELFCDIAGLQAAQRRMLEARKLYEYLEPSGVIVEGAGGGQRGSSPIQSIDDVELLTRRSETGVRCLIIDGPAGVGKTSCIERMSLMRVKSGGAPIIHVTSNGRRLSNLRDAFAGTLSDLRSKIVPDYLSILVRYGVAQVAIDGFDEFVDPDGYKDAWAVLKDFIRACGDGSSLILAGRDTFFDQQKFQTQLDTLYSPESIRVVRLGPVTPAKAREWLRKKNWSDAELSSPIASSIFKNDSYALRPFFLSQIATLQSWDALMASGKSPQGFIIDNMIEREADILARAINIESSKVASALVSVFEEIAEDLGERESNSVSLDYLTFVAEFAFSALLDPQQIGRLRHQIGSIAFIESGGVAGYVKFAHEEIQDRFLVRGVIKRLIDGSLPASLRRSIFGSDRIAIYADEMRSISVANATAIMTFLMRTVEEMPRSVTLSGNCTCLVVSSVSFGGDDRRKLDVSGYFASDVALRGECSNACLMECTVLRLDARNADISNVKWVGGSIDALRADTSTLFASSTPAPRVLTVEQEGGSTDIFETAVIAKFIKRRSPRSADVALTVNGVHFEKTFERIARKFRSQIMIRMIESDDGSYLLTTGHGPRIMEILRDEGALTEVDRPTSGAKRAIFTMPVAAELLNPQTEDELASRIRKRIHEEAASL